MMSFSQPPSPPLQATQVDPISALTSSISFGRYVTESLEWEKWSTFTHNRYKEEAERYSKPGSVAQMKAYFEAHYKKKAADRSAALNEQQNEGSNLKSTLETETVGTAETEDAIVVSSAMSKCIPCEGKGADDAQILNDENSLLADRVATRNQHNVVEDVQICESIPNREQKGQDTLMVKAEEPLFADHVEVRNPARDVESSGTDAVSEQEKTPINVAGRLGDSGSLDNDKSTICSSKSRNSSGIPKPPVPPKSSVSLQKRRHNNADIDTTVTRSVEKEKLTIGSPVPQRPSVSLLKGKHNIANTDRKVTNPVPQKPSVSLQKGKHNNANPDRKVTNMADGKRTMSRLLHLSSHSANETKKKPMSPILERILKSRLVKTLAGKTSKVSRGKPLRDSVQTSNINGAAAIEDKKISRSESPDKSGAEARPPIVERSFSFKSEERAAKRKEFFERLEHKAKVKMAENEKLHRTKDKARKDPKQKSESSKTSSNVIKKFQASAAVPRNTTTLACASTRTPSKVQENNSLSPWRHSTHTTTPPCSARASTRTPSKLHDDISLSPWRHSTHITKLPCSPSGSTRTPSKLVDTSSRSPWRHSTLACSSNAGTKTPSELQDNVSRSPWNNKTLPYSSSADRKTPSKLMDNNSRSPWRHTPVPSPSSVDKRTPSRVQDNNSRPPWRLATKGNHCKEIIEKNNRSPFHPASAPSKKSTHENSSPNIQLSHES